MIKKVSGWVLIAFGVFGALFGLLAVLGGAGGDGWTMVGIGGVLFFTGWPLRGSGNPTRGTDNDGDYSFGDSDGDYDSGDANSGDSGDSGGSSD